MINSGLPLYLASKSPRRRKLLKQINIDFKAFSVELKEEILDGEHPIRTVKRLAEEKLNIAIQRIKRGIIITADTIVVLNHHVLGKPKDQKDAKRILNLLSNNIHLVYTGYAVYSTLTKKTIVGYEKTFVKFRKLSEEEIDNYIKSGSPLDKAGAYGIQDDFGAVFVEKIIGCYYNVVGLPLTKIYRALTEVVLVC
jgi:septum formation protein